MSSTIFPAFLECATSHASRECVATIRGGSYYPMTYQMVLDRTVNIAQRLHSRLQPNDTIGILADNGPHWISADLAAAYRGLIVVPLHTTYTFPYIKYIINHANIRYLIIGKSYYIKYRSELQQLQMEALYVIDGEVAETRGVRVLDSLLMDARVVDTPHESGRDDLHTIVYTSGTTGTPKGVMLTHHNLLSNVNAAKKNISVFPHDRFFSFLPLAHILERTAGYYVPILSGAAIYYGRGRETLIDDLRLAQPTILVSVPRIFEKAHERIEAKFSSSPLLRTLFIRMQKLRNNKNRGSHLTFLQRVEDYIYSALFIKKIAHRFGGRLRFAVSGGAALAKHVAEFFNSIGILIVEGYGLTETSPIVTMNTLERYKFGTVGIPLENMELKIDTKGEILVRGDGLMKGYYQSKELTAEIIDGQGWFHTGDLGHLDNEGFLTITGRLKEMIVLSTGRNIFPVILEQALEESKFIAQAMIYGDGQKAVAALIVPDFSTLQQWCAEKNIEYKVPGVFDHADVIQMYQDVMKQHLKEFQSYEQVQKFHLISKEFTQEDDFLTPTLKLKRSNILNAYQHILNRHNVA